jgi:isoquinoline 1-oxidoreductase alpha subunit
MAATALLKQVKQPTNEQIAAAMVNLCRCGTYNAISAAVHDLAGIAVAHSSAVASQTVKPTEHTLNKTVAAATVAVAGIGTVAAIHWKKSQKSKAEGDES